MATRQTVTLMLVGDVMTGRGIDQILPHPCAPVLYEPFVKSAADYVEMAEQANGPIRRPVPFDYPWGDAIDTLAGKHVDARIINLETAVTRADNPWPKGINYRMNPDNVPCLTEAGIDCCVLANNHVIDWGREGLLETIRVLQRAGLKTAGAGRNRDEAALPAILPTGGGGRVLVYAFAGSSSGVPSDWAATTERPGVNFLADLSEATVASIATQMGRHRQHGDVVICSLHWGPNWGYEVLASDRAFAHRLVETADVDVVYGHSSHHAKAIEIHRGKPVFYGCGDFLNDYEGIRNEDIERYRDDLTLMYLVEIATERRQLAALDMIPFHIRNFRLGYADRNETEWLRKTMNRECGRYGGSVRFKGKGNLTMVLPQRPPAA